MPKLSVVIPTYNRAHLIIETMEAILGQTRVPDEIIVVDDGSNDNTSEVLERFQPAITYMKVKNGGDLAARNEGLALSSGELVAFCDSDDVWCPDFLVNMEALWAAEPRVLAAFSNFRILRDDVLSERTKFQDAPKNFWSGERQVGPALSIFDGSLVDRLIEFQPFFPSAMVVHRCRFLELGGWDEGVSRVIGGDFATALRVANAPPIGVCHSPLVKIRKHSTNFSNSTEAMNLGDAKVIEHVMANRPELASHSAAFERSVARRRTDAFDSAFARNDFSAARKIAAQIPLASLSLRHHIKKVIARLPNAIGIWLAETIGR